MGAGCQGPAQIDENRMKCSPQNREPMSMKVYKSGSVLAEFKTVWLCLDCNTTHQKKTDKCPRKKGK